MLRQVSRLSAFCWQEVASQRLSQACAGSSACNPALQQQHCAAAHLLRSAAPSAAGALPTPAHGAAPFGTLAGEAFNANRTPLQTGRPRVVVLGTGWAAARLTRDIDPKLYDITVVSPRNHMVFTPLLSSTTVGTLESRSVAVHITSIQKALHDPQNAFVTGHAKNIVPAKKLVECESGDGVRYNVHYDKLVIATGSQGSTFGIPGVHEHAHFLRNIRDAEEIRSKVIQNIACAGVPGRTVEEYMRLLHIVLVGGGPTGVEVAGELSNLINRDLQRIYPERARAMRVTLIEAKELLGSFDLRLREYAARKLTSRGVQLLKGVVKKVEADKLTLTDGTELRFGLCIWSTGVGPTPFITSLPFGKTPVGRLAVDGYQRVLAAEETVRSANGKEDQAGTEATQEDKQAQAAFVHPTKEHESHVSARLKPVDDIYALGDCCANTENPLPALAQVAEQQGKYLARVLNAEAKHETNEPPEPFQYKSLGSMATVGGTSAILELGGADKRHWSMAGFVSWVAWRSAYLTRLGSMRNRLVVMFDWTMTLLFGRDLSRW